MQSGIAPTVVVRQAVPGDPPAMAALHVRAWRATYAGLIPDEFLAGLKVEDREAMWRRSVTAPEVAPAERVILVAEQGGAVVGFAAAGHARGDDEFGLGELYALNVDPPAWGRGQGLRRGRKEGRQRSRRRLWRQRCYIGPRAPASPPARIRTSSS